jgi:hypothetical protein
VSTPRNRPALPTVLLVVLVLPAATLVAGFTTLAVIGRGGLDTVSDPVRRTAQVQQVDDRADRRAAALGLRAELRQAPGDGTRLALAAALAERPALPNELVLHLEHPLDARLDRELRLQRGGADWRGAGFDAAPGWRVSLTPADGRWRLVGRWPRGGDALELLPALPAGGEAGDGTG